MTYISLVITIRGKWPYVLTVLVVVVLLWKLRGRRRERVVDTHVLNMRSGIGLAADYIRATTNRIIH